MCSAACASSRFLPSEAYGGSFPTTPIPGCMSYWISWALITGCTHGLQVRASSERLEGRRLKKTNGLHRPGVRNGGRNRSVATRTAGWPLDNLLSHHFPLEPEVSGTSLVGELVPGLLGILPAGEAFLAQLGHGRLPRGAFLGDALRRRVEAALVLGAGVHDDNPVAPAVQPAGVGARAVHRTVGAFGQPSDEFPAVLLEGPLLELTGHLVGRRQPGDKTQPGPGHLLEVLAGDESRIGHIQQLHGVQKA